MEFKRQLSAQALEYLRTDGNYIIPEIVAARKDEPFSLDIQIRVNNELMVYMGNTRILIIKIKTRTGQVVFKAHPNYWDPFLGTYPFSNVPRGEITAYLIRTKSTVNSNFYSNYQEGYFQNKLCLKYGENTCNNSMLIIFDRESEIGFSNTQERADIFNPIVERYQDIRRRLQNEYPEKYGSPTDGSMGKGLDLLAIDKHCNLICIELKHQDYGSEIYWGVLQLAVYHELFNALYTLEPQVCFSNIKELIEQKVILGLLPENVMSCFNGKNTFNSVKSCLVVAEPNFRMDCWDKMGDVISAIPVAFRCKVLTMDNDCKFSIYL